MTPFFLVTGFLGSGKTAFLKNLLTNWSGKYRIAIIQNEFASSGVDGKELKLADPHFKLIEINNGSVFCVCLLSNFIETLDKLLSEYQPEFVFLEASGLADPINIVEMLQAPRLQNRICLTQIVTLVDALHIERSLAMLERTRHQVLIADTILLNKTDLYSGNLNQLCANLTQLNPFARILTTQYGKMPPEQLTEADHRASAQFLGRESEGRPKEILTSVVRTHDHISRKNLESFLREAASQCIRIKGFIHTDTDRAVCFQVVYEQIEIRELEHYNGSTEIIAFSPTLSAKDLRHLLRKYTDL